MIKKKDPQMIQILAITEKNYKVAMVNIFNKIKWTMQKIEKKIWRISPDNLNLLKMKIKWKF